MAQFEKTTTTKHSIFYHPVGERIFVYQRIGSDLGKIIGDYTVLAEIIEVQFIETTCSGCNGKDYNIHYKVKVIDAVDASKIGIEVEISPKNAVASKLQSKADYHGRWWLYRDENIQEPQVLIKPILTPDVYFFQETIDLMHIAYPGAYVSKIISKDQIGEYAVQKLREHYEQITYIGYETIGMSEDGEKAKGYRFEFSNKGLNFIKYC